MPFCKNCGTKIDFNSSICPSCGKFVDREEERVEYYDRHDGIGSRNSRESSRLEREVDTNGVEHGTAEFAYSAFGAGLTQESIPENPKFFRAIVICLVEKYGTFRGRAGRAEFWYFILFLLLTHIALNTILGPFDPEPTLKTSAVSVESTSSEDSTIELGALDPSIEENAFDEAALRDALANITEEDLNAESDDAFLEELTAQTGEETEFIDKESRSEDELYEQEAIAAAICFLIRFVVFIALFTPLLAVSIRRFHDSDKSGAVFFALNFGIFLGWVFVFVGIGCGFGDEPTISSGMGMALVFFGLFISFICFVIITTFMCFKGTPGQNRYGLPVGWTSATIDKDTVWTRATTVNEMERTPETAVDDSNPFALKNEEQSAQSPLDL